MLYAVSHFHTAKGCAAPQFASQHPSTPFQGRGFKNLVVKSDSRDGVVRKLPSRRKQLDCCRQQAFDGALLIYQPAELGQTV
jgi:hypothetical protein